MVKNMGQGDGTYKMIGIYGKNSGAHCMAAFVGTDAVFFDPNFGEFYFPSRDDLARFIGADFWKKSWYDRMLAGRYTLRDYARAIGSGHQNFAGKF
jgi:hypothetical protein